MVQGKDHLGIGLRAENHTFTLELLAQFQEVVYFTIEYDYQAAIGRKHRLVTLRRKIDDTEAPMGQTDKIVKIFTTGIWAAMTDNLTHPAKCRFIRIRGSCSNEAGYAAHWMVPVFVARLEKTPAPRANR